VVSYTLRLERSGRDLRSFAPQGIERNDEFMNMFLTVIQVILSLAIVAVVMLQSGKSAGLSGAIAGGAETFLSKNKAKSLDAKLAKATKWVAIAWVLVTLALCIVH